MFGAKLCENTEMFGCKQKKRCNNRCTACRIVNYACVVCSFEEAGGVGVGLPMSLSQLLFAVFDYAL